MNKKRAFNIDLTLQNKLMFLGFIFSTAIIIVVALISMTQIKNSLSSGYTGFGQLLTKTLAVQTAEFTRDLPDAQKVATMKKQADTILKSNSAISFVTFKDAQGKVLYSTSDTNLQRSQTAEITASSPVNSGGQNIGQVEIGFSTSMASAVTKTTRNSMLWVFTIVWLAFMVITIINMLIIKRELTLLHHGVKEISNGRFGTVLDYSQASGETKELFTAFNDMSKRLHNYEEQNVDTLTLEKNKLEAVLMSIANGVVVCDNFDKITIINPAAQKILGVAAAQIMNSHIQDYTDTNGDNSFKEKITLFKNTPLDIMEKKPLEFSVNIDARTVKAIISPIYSKMRDYLGYIVILIDITKEAEVDKLKNDFISNVSHELRTPVTVLRSYADTLYNFGQDFNFNEQKEFIGTINQEVIRLNKMVNDVLDFSKLQGGKAIEKHTQDITRTIEGIIGSLKVLADEKQITFSVIKEPGLPEVPYNNESIERVLSNLITNALKYSPSNSRVKIRAEVAKNPDFIEISIEDFGNGIEAKHLDKIFDRFYRIETAVHTIKGTGLGLHLVKVAIEKHHGGEVFVHSKVGEGSTFGFRLPVKLSENEITKAAVQQEAAEQVREDIAAAREVAEDIEDEETQSHREHRELIENFVPEITSMPPETLETLEDAAQTPDQTPAETVEEVEEETEQVETQTEIIKEETKEEPEAPVENIETPQIEPPQENSGNTAADWQMTFEIRERAN